MRSHAQVMSGLMVVAASVLVAGCTSSEPEPRTDQATFRCSNSALNCLVYQACPTVPLGPRTCGDVPGLFGHEPVHIEGGRPIGCVVTLPYENPYYLGWQQECQCSGGPNGGAAVWSCAI